MNRPQPLRIVVSSVVSCILKLGTWLKDFKLISSKYHLRIVKPQIVYETLLDGTGDKNRVEAYNGTGSLDQQPVVCRISCTEPAVRPHYARKQAQLRFSCRF